MFRVITTNLPTDIAALIFYGVAGMFLLGGLWFVVSAARRLRARNIPHCPRCDYALAGLPGAPASRKDAAGTPPVCPECGFRAKSGRTLFRARQRPRRVATALLCLLLAVGAFLTPRVRRDGWPSVCPTTVLIWLLPPLQPNVPSFNRSTAWDGAQDELVNRLEMGGGWEWQHDWLIGKLTSLHTRARWPVGMPVAVNTRSDQRVTFTSIASSYAYSGSMVEGSALEASGRATVEVRAQLMHSFTFTSSRRGMGLMPQTSMTYHGTIHATPVATAEEAIDPVSTPQADAAARARVKPMVTVSDPEVPGGNHPALLSVWVEPESSKSGPQKHDPLSGIALGIRADVLLDGKVVASALGDGRNHRALSLWLADLEPLIRDPAQHGRMVLRITGDATASLPCLDMAKYWKGELTYPFAEIVSLPPGPKRLPGSIPGSQFLP
jgi:hypothetical protein